MVLELKNQGHVLTKYRLKEAQRNAHPRFGTETSVAENESNVLSYIFEQSDHFSISPV